MVKNNKRMTIINLDELMSGYCLYRGSIAVEPEDISKAIAFFNKTRLVFTLQEYIQYCVIDCYQSPWNKQLSISIGHGESKNVKHMRQLIRESKVSAFCMLYLLGLYKSIVDQSMLLIPVNRPSASTPKFMLKDAYARVELAEGVERIASPCKVTLSEFRQAYSKRMQADLPQDATPVKLNTEQLLAINPQELFKTETAIKA